MSTMPAHARGGKKAAPASPEPVAAASLQKKLTEAQEELDGARESLEELLWSATDATSETPSMEPTSMQLSIYQDAANCLYSMRAAQRQIREVSWELSRRGAR